MTRNAPLLRSRRSLLGLGVLGATLLAGMPDPLSLPVVQPDTLQPANATAPTAMGFPASVTATNPALAAARITVPPNALFSDDGSRGGRIGMAPVPPARLPGPLPEGLELAMVFTVQTDGAGNFDQPATVCLPNDPGVVAGAPLSPGAKRSLISFDHKKGVWESVGLMTVTADPSSVTTDSFRLYAAGPDGALGTADDEHVAGGTAGYRAEAGAAWRTFPTPFGAGRYRAVLTRAIRDPAGNALPTDLFWEFEVFAADLTTGGSALASGQIERPGAQDVLAPGPWDFTMCPLPPATRSRSAPRWSMASRRPAPGASRHRGRRTSTSSRAWPDKRCSSRNPWATVPRPSDGFASHRAERCCLKASALRQP